MPEFFARMNEDYASKHFPDGVFQGVSKTIKRRGVLGIFFFGIFSAFPIFGFVWTVKSTIKYIISGDNDMVTTGLVVSGFLALITLICIIGLVLMVRSMLKGREGYIKDSAKNSKLPISEIEEFERQAVATDSYILKMTSGLDRALASSTNKDGLLTRDYIYLADPSQTVMRVDTLKACFFTDYTYYISTGNRHKKIRNLAICLIAPEGVSVVSDTDEKPARALMDILKERNSAIDINGGNIVHEGKEFDEYKKRFM